MFLFSQSHVAQSLSITINMRKFKKKPQIPEVGHAELFEGLRAQQADQCLTRQDKQNVYFFRSIPVQL